MAEMSRRTTSRRDLSRNEHFDDVSPEVGVIDEEAFGELLEHAPDEALELLADMSGATDVSLAALARSLAGRVVVDFAQRGAPRRRGIGRLERLRASKADGDIDIDASLDVITEGRHGVLDADALTVSGWRRPSTALCLLVDCSGSMRGDRLAAAAVAAAAVMYRHGQDCSVIAFSDDAVVVKAQDSQRNSEDVVADLFRLRGHGVTDVGLALRAARLQLERSRAQRKVAVLLSDCRSTEGGDPTDDAARIEELAIIAPSEDTADAEHLADSVGARCVGLDGPAAVPAAIAQALLDS